MPHKPTPRTTLTNVGPWTLGKTLGRGAYAHVRLATHSNGHKAACKILPALHRPRTLPASWDETIDAIEAHKEVVLLKALSGAGVTGIVGLEGVVEEGGWTYVFLKLYDHSASSIGTPWGRDTFIPFFRKLLHTVHAIHSLDVSHEDLKRSNILLNKHYHPILVDFGFSHFKAGGGLVQSAGGTLDYSSPEKVQDKNYDPKANDVWAIGILLLKLLGIHHPFCLGSADETSAAVKGRIVYEEPNFHWRPEHLGECGLAELVYGMLEKSPTRRFNIPQILAHPYLKLKGDRQKEYVPPDLLLPHEVPIPLPTSVIEDVAFLAYLNKGFVLCESMKKTKNKILGSQPCWEKRWAGMLCRWRKREELDWEDVGPRTKEPCGSSQHKRLGGYGRALREIYLSPNVITPQKTQPTIPENAAKAPTRKSLISHMKGRDASTRNTSILSSVTVKLPDSKPIINTDVVRSPPKVAPIVRKNVFKGKPMATARKTTLPDLTALADTLEHTKALPRYATGGATTPSMTSSMTEMSTASEDTAHRKHRETKSAMTSEPEGTLVRPRQAEGHRRAGQKAQSTAVVKGMRRSQRIQNKYSRE